MSESLSRETTNAGTNHYRIKVKGTLEPYWSDRLGGLHLMSADGTTTLSGQIIDQASLHGLIAQIRDLGLPLLLVEEIDDFKKPEIPNLKLLNKKEILDE